MLELIGMVFVYGLIFVGAIAVFGPIAFILYRMPKIIKFIKGTIKWNLDKFKKDDWYYSDKD